jgi:hypothetical protein
VQTVSNQDTILITRKAKHILLNLFAEYLKTTLNSYLAKLPRIFYVLYSYHILPYISVSGLQILVEQEIAQLRVTGLLCMSRQLLF